MRVAEETVGHEGCVGPNLRIGVERTAGVIQVRFAGPCEPTELALAQLVEIRLVGRDGLGQHPRLRMRATASATLGRGDEAWAAYSASVSRCGVPPKYRLSG